MRQYNEFIIMNITKYKISKLSLPSRKLIADKPKLPISIISINSIGKARVLALAFGIGTMFFVNLIQEVQANDSISDTSQTTNTTNNTNNEDSLLMSIWNIFKPKPSQPLTNFRYSYGGNMNGNSHSEVVTVINGETILSISHANWYYEPQKVSEYIVDSTLKEIDDICQKYKMKSWENKKFSDIFVSDGESYSYSFSFGEDESFYFSSQIFPSPYREQLKEIHNVIDKGLKAGRPIPGIVLPKLSEEEIFERRNNPKDEVTFEVTGYRLSKITYNINNNTSNEITIPKDYTTKLLLGDTVIHEEKASRSRDYTISQKSNIEKTIKLDKFLELGIYKLEVDSYSTEFEIK